MGVSVTLPTPGEMSASVPKGKSAWLTTVTIAITNL